MIKIVNRNFRTWIEIFLNTIVKIIPGRKHFFWDSLVWSFLHHNNIQTLISCGIQRTDSSEQCLQILSASQKLSTMRYILDFFKICSVKNTLKKILYSQSQRSRNTWISLFFGDFNTFVNQLIKDWSLSNVHCARETKLRIGLFSYMMTLILNTLNL